MTQEQLIEYAMNPDKQEVLNTGTLNKYPVLGNYNQAYDPYTEIYERDEKGTEGEKVPDFLAKQPYKLPAFVQQDPVDILRNLNVEDTLDRFRREDNVNNTLNSLFNQPTGNTPEERAKSQTINTLLAEIDNFAKQYRLSKSQVDTLKTQVLGNHLGEYINVKNALEKQQKDQERAEQIAQAKGEQPKQLPEEDAPAPAPAPKGGGAVAGAGGGDDDDIIRDIELAGRLREPDQEANQYAIRMIQRIRRMTDENKKNIIIQGFKSHKPATWRKALTISSKQIQTPAERQFMSRNNMRAKVDFILNVLPGGTNLNASEINSVMKAIQMVKRMIQEDEEVEV